jgi:hypothetical protein
MDSPAMAVCDECGSRQVAEAEVAGTFVLRCALCGHMQGDPNRVEAAETHQEAEERGYAPEVYPLVKALETVPTFKVAGASSGRTDGSEYPFVFLRLATTGLRDLERLLTSLEMANRSTKRRWVVETTLQRGLLFILRPRFWKRVQDIDSKDIQEARADLPVLAASIQRDVRLSWWAV